MITTATDQQQAVHLDYIYPDHDHNRRDPQEDQLDVAWDGQEPLHQWKYRTGLPGSALSP
jgi:hypothetical protein